VFNLFSEKSKTNIGTDLWCSIYFHTYKVNIEVNV